MGYKIFEIWGGIGVYNREIIVQKYNITGALISRCCYEEMVTV